ncbi:hypothetical protein DWB58_07180 [candidate division KSB1 bacterium]|nr:hypothetical protein [candidate division KSB1 bacterium]MCE7940253.1 hypothetical protein [Chlorobi bacterium CHB1]
MQAKLHNAKKAIFSENIKREKRGEKIRAGVRKELLCTKVFKQVEKRGASSSLVNFVHKSGNLVFFRIGC